MNTTALQPDGKIVIGGLFTSYNGTARNRVARLNPDGSIDKTFDPGSGANNYVSTATIQPDGKIVIVGSFTSYNGTARNCVARLNSDGSLDTTFDPAGGASAMVNAMALQPDGRIIIVGGFSSYSGVFRGHIARLNTDGSLDTAFDPGSGAFRNVYAVALQTDGRIIIGGDFTSYNNIFRSHIARLNSDGSLDATFDPSVGADNTVSAIALQSDGKIIIGGSFGSFNTRASFRHIARVNSDGSVDNTFDPGSGADFTLNTIALQPDGKIIIGGGFTTYNGTPRYFIARLLSAPPSSNALAFSQANYSVGEGDASATITVIRSGDTLEPASVQYSTTGPAYTPCTEVNGTAAQNCDYLTASGTLTFAPGESTKNFTVLIIDDNYVEGDESIQLTLSDPVNVVVGTPATATLTIKDNDTAAPTTSPVDDAQAFVRQHYYDFLSRVPDDGGLGYWSSQITGCGADKQCINSKRISVSNAFFFELEYQQTGAYVYRLYRAAFGNNQPSPNPDTSNTAEAKKYPSYAAFSQDRAKVVGGSSLAQTQLNLAKQFVQRPKFLAKYPLSQGAITFVDAILATIKNEVGVDLTSQRDALISLFNQSGRGAVLYRLADDNAQSNPINNRAFIDAEYNRAFVATQYFGYLRRDADIGGLLFWLGKVNQFPLRSTAIQNAMVCSFITSQEYQLRFSSVVTRTNAECPQ